MKSVVFIGLGLALALASTSSLAFQEQGGGAPAVATPAPAAPNDAKAPDTQSKDLGFSSAKPDGEGTAGTEVRIPGLGRLGVLPKMDFGLELLYGASETKQVEPEPQQPGEDITIRGSLKHNF